jgi:hypothetical protein
MMSIKTPSKGSRGPGTRGTVFAVRGPATNGIASGDDGQGLESDPDRHDGDVDLMAMQIEQLKQSLADAKNENLELERKARVFEIKAINKSETADEIVNRLKLQAELELNDLKEANGTLTNLLDEANDKIHWLESALADKQDALSAASESNVAATAALLDLELKFDILRGKTNKVRPCASLSHQRTFTVALRTFLVATGAADEGLDDHKA